MVRIFFELLTPMPVLDLNVVAYCEILDECTVKKDSGSNEKESYGENFSRNTFFTMEEMAIPCDSGLCDAMEEGFECVEGYNVNANIDDEMKVCKTYKKVTKEWTYALPRQKSHAAAVIFLALLLSCSCCCGSYIYYLRHSKVASEKVHHDDSPPPEEPVSGKADYAELT